MFAHQQEIFSVNDPPGKLMELVKSIPGLDFSAFKSCLASSRPDSPVKMDRQVELANGIAQTPTIFVDDLRIDWLPTESAI